MKTKIVRTSDYNACKAKKAYDTVDEANDAGKLSMHNYEGTKQLFQLYIYECNVCNKFHLTREITNMTIY